MESNVYGDRLRGNFAAIVRDLDPSKYWNYLYQEGIFDEDDMDDVKSKGRRKPQAEVLLEKVQRSGAESIAVFVNLLGSIQPHLYQLLQRELPGPRLPQRQAGPIQTSVEDVTHQITGVHVHGQPRPFVRKALRPVEHEGDGKPSDALGNADSSEHHLRQTVPPADEGPPFITPTDLSKLPAHIRPDSEEVYPINSRPRGIALIINIEFFVPSSEHTAKEQEREKLDARLGSDKDLASLEKLFEALDFKVKTERNIEKQKILKVLDDTATDDHSTYDCFVLCLMSHGKEGSIYGADGETVLIETICDFFSNSNCATLRGKPKLFIIQACRGREKEKGVAKDSPNSSESQPSTADDEEERKEESADRGWNFTLPEIIPDHADILMAYSTVSGYASFRNPRDGSRFVRCLVEVFQEKAGHEDVLSMLTMVNKRISSMGEIDSKQVGQPTSTLTKKLFLWPGL